MVHHCQVYIQPEHILFPFCNCSWCASSSGKISSLWRSVHRERSHRDIVSFFYKNSNGLVEIVTNILQKGLLFTPFTVTRFAMHRNQAFAWFRAALLGFSVNFVHKKHLAERYQWTVTERVTVSGHFLFREISSMIVVFMSSSYRRICTCIGVGSSVSFILPKWLKKNRMPRPIPME